MCSAVGNSRCFGSANCYSLDLQDLLGFIAEQFEKG